MASLHGAQEDPYAPIERLQDANRRLQEATVRLKQSNARMECHLAELRLCVARLREKYPEPSDKLSPH
ncbi:hypothetical protein [Modicisalibacter muralis]|nr:hypothetical protein [Halomonas muralis]